MQSISRIIKIAFALTVVSLAAGCASGPDLRTDYDKTADFSQYKTYNFLPNAGPNNGQYQTLFTKYVKEAIDTEMQTRGYEKSDNPDLLVNFNAVLQDKTKVTTSPVPMGAYGYGGMGYYGYRRGFYDPWMGYGYAQETNVSQYTEGTFNIDIVDARHKRLVWETVGVGRVTDKQLDNIEAAVKKAVPQYFAKFPFKAGSGTPVTKDKK
ncbi:MAG TPA: DUF4136 domain-containing protein [Woeseiaceae bacterium]|nr:DUF4136 domain-containing protein [Woeseiaceae bacterium]